MSIDTNAPCIPPKWSKGSKNTNWNDVFIDDISRELTPSGRNYLDALHHLLHPVPEDWRFYLSNYFHRMDPIAQNYLREEHFVNL